MKVLRIFDVSAFIHAGSVNKRSYLLPELRNDADAFRECKIQTGGASLLWNILYYEFGNCDMVFCSDRRATIKQGMYARYKENREHKTNIIKERTACECMLEDCGLTVLYDDGYEADDFIYSVVDRYKTQYDHIYIYCNDSDMYFLVDDNVTILPSSSRAKTVTKQNFTYTVKKGAYTPYNTLTFMKILYGDSSDNIPSLSRDLADRLYSTYMNKTYMKYMGDKQVMSEMFSLFGEEALKQFSLVFPLDVRVPDSFGKGDKIRIAEWGSAMRNQYWRNGSPVPDHIQSVIEQMADNGLASSI